MSEIVVDSVEANGTRIRASVSHSSDLRRFFTGKDFFVEYDEDVSKIPEGVLSIPVLAQICPVAWAVGADVRVPAVDRRFLDSLRVVGSVLCEMYPSFMQGGTVIAGESIDASDAYRSGSEVGMLFTGGVDSLATYIEHRDKNPTLINVQGWLVGIEEDERWAGAKEHVESYGSKFDVETTYVRSNMLSFLETPMLSAHFSDYHDGGWYSAVGGGVGLLGLCAPLTVARNMEHLHIAASKWEGMPVPDVLSHWDGRGMPWGSHPDIDENVAWGATEVSHDVFNLTRQGRVGIIADYIKAGHQGLPVRSCEGSDIAGNCNQCEKCFRTALGLLIEGIDPNRHGFDLDEESFEYARDQLASGTWFDDVHTTYFWEDLRCHLPPELELSLEGAPQLIDWLREADFERLGNPPARDRVIRTVARHTPYSVYSAVYPAYTSLKRAIE